MGWNVQWLNGTGAVTANPNLAIGTPSLSKIGGQLHYAYRDSNGTIWHLVYDNGAWMPVNQLNANALTSGPPADGDPILCDFGGQTHCVYRAKDGTIQDAYWDGSWKVQLINGTDAVIVNPNLATGNPSLCVIDRQMHYAYRDSNGTIWHVKYENGWKPVVQINAGGVTNGPPADGDPILCNFGGSTHCAYRDKNGTI
jgi:hypothetical protein